MIGDKAAGFAEGIKLAEEIIDSGAAQQKLEQLITASNDLSVVK